MAELPEPLVPVDLDLSPLDGFMLDTVRLLGSELVALSTGDEFKAAVLLWARAWKQRPAASLPNDDRALASYAGYGTGSRVDLKGFQTVRPMAMRGFVLCSDNRWYHPVLAEDANRAGTALKKRRKWKDDKDRQRAGPSGHDGGQTGGHDDGQSDGRSSGPDIGQPADKPMENRVHRRDGTGRDLSKKVSTPKPPESNKVAQPAFDTGEAFERLVTAWGIDDHRVRALQTFGGIVAKAVDPEVLTAAIIEGAKLRAAVRTRFTPAADKRLDQWLAEQRWTERPKLDGEVTPPPVPMADKAAAERRQLVLTWSRKRLLDETAPWPDHLGAEPAGEELTTADAEVERAMFAWRDQGQIVMAPKPTVAEFEAAQKRRDTRIDLPEIPAFLKRDTKPITEAA